VIGWLAAVGWAAPQDEAIEEIVVYGDDFARWDNTRWLVQNEQWIPLGIRFSTDDNHSFLSHAFQIRAVIACNKDAKLSKKKWEVSCEIEDIGLAVTTVQHWRRERDRALAQEILDQIDAKLTGMAVQMQVDEEGGVTNFDLEGLSTQNQRERAIQESLRQLVSRTMSGFHLRIPEHAQRSGQWVEYNSKLMDMPSLTASRGSTTMVHQVSPYRDLQLVQTLGQGTVAVNVPYTTRDMFAPSLNQDDPSATQASSGGSLGGALGGKASAPETSNQPEPQSTRAGGGPNAEMEIPLTYTMNASGVAVLRKSDGIMSERVWTVEGMPTASSGGGVVTAPFRNAGRIQLLGKDDHPDVGATYQVAWPGQKMEDLPPWVSVEVMPGAGPG
jgi:hypothetical protein